MSNELPPDATLVVGAAALVEVVCGAVVSGALVVVTVCIRAVVGFADEVGSTGSEEEVVSTGLTDSEVVTGLPPTFPRATVGLTELEAGTVVDVGSDTMVVDGTGELVAEVVLALQRLFSLRLFLDGGEDRFWKRGASLLLGSVERRMRETSPRL